MKNWEKAQNRVAHLTGGKLVPFSGKSRRKGDVATEDYLIEVKETSKDRFTITLDLLDKIYNEALIEKKSPVLVIEFSNKDLICLVLCSEPVDLYLNKSFTVTTKHIGRVISFGSRAWRIYSGDYLSEL